MADLEAAADLLAEAWRQTPDQGPVSLRRFTLAALELGAEIGCGHTDREADWILHGRPSIAADGRPF